MLLDFQCWTWRMVTTISRKKPAGTIEEIVPRGPIEAPLPAARLQAAYQ
jgi:hypothetical protein